MSLRATEKPNYYTTKIMDVSDDVSIAEKISNCMIRPARWICHGKSYLITPGGIVCNNGGSACQRAGKSLLAIVGILTVIPAVFVGIGLVIKALNQRAIEKYEILNALIATAAPIVKGDKLSKAPAVIKPSQEEMQNIASMKDCSDLNRIWSEVGRSQCGEYPFQYTKKMLAQWIEQEIPDHRLYTYISEKLAPYAAAQLQQDLKLIINLLNNNTFSEKKTASVIMALVDSSNVCSPTWLETARKQYQLLKGGDTESDIFLRYCQEAKESLILASTSAKGLEWHVINYVRKLLHKNLGLDVSNSEFDSVIKISFFAKLFVAFQRSKYLHIFFYQIFTPEKMINSIVNQINIEYFDTSGYAQEISGLCQNAALQHAMANNIDTSNDDFDLGNYTMEMFYTADSKQHYTINAVAVLWMLRELNIV